MASNVASKVERIKWEMELDPNTPLVATVAQANKAMRLPADGTLPEQVDRLLVVMGIALRSDNISPAIAASGQRPPPQRPPPPSHQRPPPPQQRAAAPAAGGTWQVESESESESGSEDTQ